MTVAGQNLTTDRRRDRHRKAAATSVSSMAGRVVALSASLAAISIAVDHLPRSEFGLWITITSLTALLGAADLGIGNGVLSAVASATGRDDVRAVRAAVSNGAVMLSAIAITVLLIAVMVLPVVDWNEVFGLRGTVSPEETLAAVFTFVTCVALSIPAGIAAKVLAGMQQGYVAAAWQGFGSGLGLLFVALAARLNADVAWFVAAWLGGPLCAAVLNSGWYFILARPDLRPSRSLLELSDGRRLLQLGGLYFVLQVTAAVVFASDNLIIARILGAAEVVDYALSAKLFGITSIIVGMALQPLWPAYGEAIARRDLPWVWNMVRTSTILAVLLAAAMACTLLYFFDDLTRLWLRRELSVTIFLLAGLALWTVIEAGGNSLAMLLNGAKVVTPQVVLATILAVSCVTLKICLVATIGVDGLPWALIATYTIVSLLPSLWLLKRVMPRL